MRHNLYNSSAPRVTSGHIPYEPPDIREAIRGDYATDVLEGQIPEMSFASVNYRRMGLWKIKPICGSPNLAYTVFFDNPPKRPEQPWHGMNMVV